MIEDSYTKKKLASSWFNLLQQTICYEFEKIEFDFGKKIKKKPKYFKINTWQKSNVKNEGGGSYAIIKDGLVFGVHSLKEVKRQLRVSLVVLATK